MTLVTTQEADAAASAPSPEKSPRTFGWPQLAAALPGALRKLNPAALVRNPVMLIVWVGAAFTTVLAIAEPFLGGPGESGGTPVPAPFTAGIAVWLWRNLTALKRVRFGVVIAHAIAFVTVTTSFNLHAILRVMFLGFEVDGAGDAARTLLESSWFGATLVMSALWGLGLLVHLLGSVLGRGWED